MRGATLLDSPGSAAKSTIDEIVHDTFLTKSFSSSRSPPSTPRVKSPSCATLEQRTRPHLTISYFQSLDGALDAVPGEETLHLVHRLRSSHDAILTDPASPLAALGCGTARHYPRVILLDARLDLDLPSPHTLSGVWLVCGEDMRGSAKAHALQARGAHIVCAASEGLADVLETLYAHGVRKLVVEGRVAHSFIAASLFDKLIVTIVPTFASATSAFPAGPRPKLTNVRYEVLGSDIILTAEPDRSSSEAGGADGSAAAQL